MTRTAAQQPPQPPPNLVTVADVMRSPLTTDTNDHAAAAAYLMKHAGATGLMVLDAVTGQPKGILTEADIVHAVADGKDLNDLRIHELLTIRPAVINPATSVRDAAQFMTRGHFRHLPVTGDSGLVGIIDIVDICRALIDPRPLPPAQRRRGPGPGRPDSGHERAAPTRGQAQPHDRRSR